MPQSARVNELFSSSPTEVLAIAAVLLGILAAVAALVRRWSVTGATVPCCSVLEAYSSFLIGSSLFVDRSLKESMREPD